MIPRRERKKNAAAQYMLFEEGIPGAKENVFGFVRNGRFAINLGGLWPVELERNRSERISRGKYDLLDPRRSHLITTSKRELEITRGHSHDC